MLRFRGRFVLLFVFISLLGLSACLPGTVLPELVITAVTPALGPTTGGVKVTVTGQGFFTVVSGNGFGEELNVVICGAQLENLKVENGTVETIVLPPAGSVTVLLGDTLTGTTAVAATPSSDVVVTRPDGKQATLKGAFVCRDGLPVADDQAVAGNEDQAVPITLTSDVPTVSADYKVASGPANGSLSGTAPSLTYTPDPDFNGADSFTFTVADGVSTSAPATVAITVAAVNDPPSFTPGGDQLLPAGTSTPQSVAGWAGGVVFGPPDESGQAVLDYQVTITNNPDGIFTTAPEVADDGTLSYTPNGTPGTATVRVVLQDDGGTANGGVDTSAPQSLSITVKQPTPPLAQDDQITAVKGATNAFPAGKLFGDNGNGSDDLGGPPALLNSFGGGDAGGTVTSNAAGGTIPFAGGTLRVNADGSLTLDGPSSNGTFTFQYRLQNPSGTSDATVTITVQEGPLAVDDPNLTVKLGDTLSGDVTADNGAGPDLLGNPPAVVASFGGGDLGGAVGDHPAGATVGLAGGSLTLASDGGLMLTAPTIAGTFTFQYRLQNPSGTSDATVTITVLEPPTAVDDANPGGAYTLPVGGTLTIADGSGVDLDANDLPGLPAATITSFGGGGLGGTVGDHPAGTTVVAGLAGGDLTVNADGSFTLSTPTTGGDFTFQYRLTNVAGSSDATVTVRVQVPPVAVDDAAAPGSNPGDPFHTAFETPLSPTDGSGEDLDANDTPGFPTATVSSFGAIETNDGAGTLKAPVGTVTSNAAGSTVAPLPNYPDGSLRVNADGSFTLDPPTDYTGLLRFRYRLTNAAGSADAGVTLAVGRRPLAAPDSYPATLIGNVPIDTTTATNFSLLANDQGESPSVALVSSPNGVASLHGDGTFSFTPTPGFDGTAQLSYDLTNGFGTVTGTADIPVGSAIWFIDNSAAPGGDGSLGKPFDTLAAYAGSATAVGDAVFLFGTGSDYPGGVTLLGNQVLVGQGAGDTLAAITGFTPPADSPTLPATGGSSPTVTNPGGDGITLVSNNTVRGLVVGTTSGTGIKGDGFGTLTLSEVSIAGGGKGIDLVNGTVAATFDSVTVTSSVSGGVRLQNLSGTTTFKGLDLTTSGGTGLLVDNAGTVNVTGSTNTIGATSGVGVSITNTTIGVSGVTFRSVSSSGAVNGIVLNNTGSSGGFTITGDGGSVANGSGGSISGGTDGILLTDTSDISLNLVNISNQGDSAITGSNVTNLVLNRMNVSSSGNAVGENSIDITNLRGSSTFSNSTFTASSTAERLVRISNNVGNASQDRLTITGSTLKDTFTSPAGGDLLEVYLTSNANMRVDVLSSTLSNARTNGVQMLLQNSATGVLNVTNNSMTEMGIGIDMGVDNNAGLTFDVSSNTINAKVGFGTTMVNVFTAGNASATGRVNNNPSIMVGGGSGTGIRFNLNGNSTQLVEAVNNTISGVGNDIGIDAFARDGSGVMNTTITGNSITVGAGALYDIRVQAGNGGGDTNTVCANIASNTASGAAIAAFRERTADVGATVNLQDFATDATTTWNNNSNTPVGSVSESNVGTLGGATCTSVP